MDDLSREAKNLIASIGNADGPTAQDRERVKRQLLIAAAASGAAAVASSVTKTAAAAGPTLLGGTAIGGSATGGAGIASTAPAAVALGATAVSNTVVTGSAATTLAAAKVSGTATLLSLSKVAWIAGACIAGAGVTGSLIAQNASDPAAQIETAATQKPRAKEPRRGEARPAAPNVVTPNVVAPSVVAPTGAAVSELARGGSPVVPVATPRAASPLFPLGVPPDSNRALVTRASAVQPRAAGPAPVAQPKLSATFGSANSIAAGTAADAETVETELSLLTAAQRALAAGDPQRALSLTDKHAANFPRSVLRTESAAVRVFALCRLGRVEEARHASRIFLQDGRNSPLAPRVLESCISSTHSGSDSETE